MTFDKPIFMGRSMQEWFISLPTFLLLLFVIFLSSSQYIHSQLLKTGESIWHDYHIMRGIQADMEVPQCDTDVGSKVAAEIARVNALPEYDEFGFPNDKPNPQAIRNSFNDQLKICETKKSVIEDNIKRISTPLLAYRTFEKFVAGITNLSAVIKKPLLIVLLVICAVSTTLHRHHISLRPIVSKMDYYVSQSAQLITALLLLYSTIMFYRSELAAQAEGVLIENLYLQWLWLISATLLIITNVWMLFKAPPEGELTNDNNFLASLLTIPLFSYMGIIAAINFLVFMGFHSGVSVFIADLVGKAGDLLLSLALYIFIGM
ncbi:MAG: hypothetical protein SVC26_00565, partial [Pseudomonadota bacterium]|nr:hypothetical protein [Pseudomonadota bacterium]